MANSANKQLIIDFYTAFQHQDWRAMSSCYHPDVRFTDPIFTDLNCHEVADMWHMLCDSANDLVLHFDHVDADDCYGSARWVAEYNYTVARAGMKRRHVKNEIFAQFQFSDGKISRHSDHFNFWHWASQALGPGGMILGWSGGFRRKVQQRAGRALTRFRSKSR